MKFLYKSPQTKTYLQQWAGGSRIVITRFYFWYLGTAMQTSTEGLLRSILYQIITELPELARTAFPDCFEAEDKPFHTPEFDYIDLNGALRRLAAAANQVETKKKLCFFIDGLDEFRGDYIELVDLLNDLSQRYDIKMLVSSRPWTVFSRAYEGIVPHLRLEDLTKDDIHLYVHNNILNATSSTQGFSSSQSMYEHSEILNLINDVVRKAEGVFLWVFLVVRDVRRGVAEGDNLSILRLRVQSFPPDLNKFFKELIYDRVDQVYARQTSQALILAMLRVQQSTKLSRLVSFLDYWLILRSAMGLADPLFPYKWEALTGPITPAQLIKAAQETRQFLSSACKDLLIMERPQVVNEMTPVTFLHRTVFDFLRTHEMHDLLVARAPECIKSGWVFHLLVWSKLNLLQYNTSEKGIMIADAALGTLHPTMSEQFVNELVSYIEERSLISSADLSSDAIHTLAAYQKFDLVQQYLVSHVGQIKDCVATALLGMSRLRQFDLEHIDLPLLRKAISNINSIAEVHEPLIGQLECCNTSWQLLLRRWYGEAKKASGSDGTKMDSLWEAAKVYILAGAPASQVFCVNPVQPGVPHTHVWSEAGEFLKDHVPPDFRSMVIPCRPPELVLRPSRQSSSSIADSLKGFRFRNGDSPPSSSLHLINTMDNEAVHKILSGTSV